MAKAIEEIEGIGPAIGEKLRKAGIPSVERLLQVGATRRARQQLAEQTGLSEAQTLRWVNMADLFRVKGVGGEYAELLEAAGVDTVKELRNRNAENLAVRMAEVNGAKKLCRRTPNLAAVRDWVEQAKTLPPAVEY